MQKSGHEEHDANLPILVIEDPDKKCPMFMRLNDAIENNEYTALKSDIQKLVNRRAIVRASVDPLYRIVKHLGKGTYGMVFKCEDKTTGNIVAVKKFFLTRRSGGDFVAADETKIEQYVQEKVALFQEVANLNEGRALAALSYRGGTVHPNIIALEKIVYDDETTPESPRLYLVMECANENNLYVEMATNPVFMSTWESKIIAARQLASALAYIHSKGYMHRDLNVLNVMVGQGGAMKIGDFGLCTTDVGRNSLRLVYVQHAWCRAPEIVFKYFYYTNAIDIWSLGTIFYYIFTRTLLLGGNSPYGDNEVINDTVLHFGHVPRDWIRRIGVYLVGDTLTKFSHTIMSAEEVFERNGSKRTTIANNPMISEVFSRMMQYDHRHRPNAAQIVMMLIQI